MPNTLEREKLNADLQRAARQLLELREQSETIADYLDVLEARVKDAGKRRVSHDEVKKRYR
jgi:hypothetical protein